MNAEFPENLVQFTERFVTDEACAAHLTAVRWPDGAICAACGGRKGWPTARGTYYCADCRHQTSLTAGTILHQSHLPLRSWLLGMWLMCTQKTGLSAKSVYEKACIRRGMTFATSVNTLVWKHIPSIQPI